MDMNVFKHTAQKTFNCLAGFDCIDDTTADDRVQMGQPVSVSGQPEVSRNTDVGSQYISKQSKGHYFLLFMLFFLFFGITLDNDEEEDNK